MTVIPNYTKVKTIIGGVVGMTTAFTVRANSVQYEVTYLLNGELKTTWLAEQEFTLDGADKQEIGFKIINKISEEQKQREIKQIIDAVNKR